MENTDNKPQAAKQEFSQMAHKVETPENISSKLTEAVRGIQNNTVKADLISNFAAFGMTIEQLMVHFNVSAGSIDSVKGTKAVVNGRFIKRAYRNIPSYGKKLVRDKLPSDGVVSRSDREDYVILLKKKLEEETDELIEANGQSNRIEELADVFEVRDMLYEVLGISRGEVKQKADLIREYQLRTARREKREEKKIV